MSRGEEISKQRCEKIRQRIKSDPSRVEKALQYVRKHQTYEQSDDEEFYTTEMQYSIEYCNKIFKSQ